MLVIHRSITIRETRRAANNSWRGLSERERDAKDGRAFDLNLFGDGRRMAQAGRDAITRGGGREPERELTASFVTPPSIFCAEPSASTRASSTSAPSTLRPSAVNTLPF